MNRARDNSRQWGTWQVYHTPAGGWRAAPQPENER